VPGLPCRDHLSRGGFSHNPPTTLQAGAERWKRIRDGSRWTDYEVSDRGRVRNRTTGRILRPYAGGSRDESYLRVTLVLSGVRRRNAYVHRLVALYHVGGRTRERCQVDHLDRDQHNNDAGNLQWVTPAENLQRRVWGICPETRELFEEEAPF
jgi:hypothetical protein